MGTALEEGDVRPLSARLARLERGRSDPADCTCDPTVLLSGDREYVPRPGDRCQRCGVAHVLRLIEVVVGPDGREVGPRDATAPRL